MKTYKTTKRACFFTYITMASIFSLPPMLFATFRRMYGISYTLLGTLVLINFFTQLIIDLIFSFFPERFNIKKTVCLMPLMTTFGMLVYTLVPTFFPQYAYLGLCVGTVIFSVAAGLSEVLLSPIVAAIPSDDPSRDMSLLHSIYAWGVAAAVVISSLFLKLFGTENWMYVSLFFALLPLITFVLFLISPIPPMNMSHAPSPGGKKGFGLVLCVACIFLGGAAEVTMTNWVSVYMESALRIPKAVGDVLGMALFAILLGIGRVLNSKYGRNIWRVLFFGMAGAVLCYVVVGLSDIPVLSVLACVLTGFFTSMLWPGMLIYMEEKIPNAGVAAYALMAAGGDMGASVAPQLMGIVVDSVAASGWGQTLGQSLSLTPEQLGVKAGMLVTALFPIAGMVLLLATKRFFGKNKKTL